MSHHPPWPKGTAAAIARSLDVYYRDQARTRRMDRLNAQFVHPGALAFDIGAHVGDRTASFLRLGATVVAVEPQPSVFRALGLIHGRDDRAALHCAAVGAISGQITLFVNSANPTTSTASHAFVEAAPGAEAWQDQIWDRSIQTPVMTLDQLIAKHGLPDFIKIDVEGHELEVLRGLSQPVHALSFEFTTLQRSVAADALQQLKGLGHYSFNFSLGEDQMLRLENWTSADDMSRIVMELPEAANSGDIYATLS